MPEPPTVFDLDSVGPPETMLTTTPKDPDAKAIRVLRDKLPPHTTVRVTNLDRTDATIAANVPENNGVDLLVPVTSGEELRFEAVLDGQYSQPADALFMSDDPMGIAFQLLPSPRFDCLKLDPAFVLDFAGAGQVNLNLENGCSSPVTLSNARTRLGLADFSLEDALPAELAAGERAQLTVSFTRAAPGFREDVLLFDVTLDGATIRYPLTLREE